MAFSLQPPELLDAITSFIPLPCDLLSLALVSKALHAIVIPHCLEFREASSYLSISMRNLSGSPPSGAHKFGPHGL
ncbi:hypothetical protein B0H17DRAFT_1065769 [Mycena rosella]|uniref:F-box domain-containing protein n=1 Tax=Mycena rosella TaxID=1033263 RepID=A0AAD7DEU0_MYCRO|nr:hypothetical protein B0H17DRAFT_1065769 [Mycena rosella]